MTVVSELSGQGHGHFGIVLSVNEYALVSNVPFDRPLHPRAFTIPAGTALHETIRLREECKDNNISLFCTTLDVERALMNHLVAAIDLEYLQELLDDVTNTITQTIPEILSHLITAYGQVDPMTLMKEEVRVRSLVWNTNDPPVNMFNK